MTELKFWECDICGKVVKYQNNVHKFSYEIKINITGSHESDDENIEYHDVCDECYKILDDFLGNFEARKFDVVIGDEIKKFTKKWIKNWKYLHTPFKASDDYIPPKYYLEALEEIERLNQILSDIKFQFLKTGDLNMVSKLLNEVNND